MRLRATARHLTALLALCLAVGVGAQQDEHAQAGKAFEALQSAHPERMPRLADRDAGDLLQVLGDSKRFPSARADLATVSDACDRAQATIVSYWLFGAMKDGQIVASVVSENAARYQDELAVLQPFLARCIARQVPLAEATLRSLDPGIKAQLRLGGLQRSRTALLQIYASLDTAVHDSRFEPAYVDALLNALADTAAAHARALPVELRAQPLKLAKAQAAGSHGARGTKWRRIAQAMSGSSCESLCTLLDTKAR